MSIFTAMLDAGATVMSAMGSALAKTVELPDLDPAYSAPLERPIARFGKLPHRPVLLVPGNTGRDGIYANTVAALLAAGYAKDEIYVVRQPQRPGGPLNQYYSKQRLTAVRERLEDIKRFTGAPAVDVIAASMGGGDALAAMQGGQHHDLLAGGTYNLGPRLDYVHTFITMASAFHGIGWTSPLGILYPAAGLTNGLNPHSAFLEKVRGRGIPARRTVAMTSAADEIVGAGAHETGTLAGAQYQLKYANKGHYGMVLETAAEQLAILAGEVPSGAGQFVVSGRANLAPDKFERVAGRRKV